MTWQAAGGIISSSLLSTPGASAIYKGGLTLYTLESRIAFAGWTPAHIENYKGPTPQIVTGLADNVRGTLGSTYTVCESGTAGPTGGSTRNRTPYVFLFSLSIRMRCIVGLTTLRGYVALAVSTPNGTYTREVETGSGDRERNMVEFAREALQLVVDVLEGRVNHL